MYMENNNSSHLTHVIKSLRTVHRRPDSPYSDSGSSVNTLEDLSLAFKQTIAMGEEALGLDSDLEIDDDDDDNVQGIPNVSRLVNSLEWFTTWICFTGD